MNTLRVALLQENFKVGAIQSNATRILEAAVQAANSGTHLALTPQMALTGYPLEDLPLRESFQQLTTSELTFLASELAQRAPALTLVLGTLGPDSSHGLTNSAVVIRDGEITHTYHRRVFAADAAIADARIFSPGTDDLIFDIEGLKVQVFIGPDLDHFAPAAEAELVVALEAEPFSPGVSRRRRERINQFFAQGNCEAALALVNAIGGQDDLVFDGGSILRNKNGEVFEAARFEREIFLADLDTATGQWQPLSAPAAPLSEVAELYEAVTLGLRDYAAKSGFSKVILGLSGGIDSALVAAIAADAVGGENVIGVSMPSAISSEHSKDDAADTAERIGLDYRVEPIASMVDAFQNQLGLEGVAYENLQARVRGMILMSISNTEGPLVLATGNKSESAMGYSTIYGDAVGGYAPIKDVSKTLVWELSWYRNRLAKQRGEVEPIPKNSITKPPSAELSPGQRDDLSLPPYDELDPALSRFLGGNASRSQLRSEGFSQQTVNEIYRLVDRSEWKRRQYPLGPKVSDVAIGRDRRLPIMNSYQEPHQE